MAETSSVVTLTLMLPLPPKQASPNARYHWRDVRKATTKYRHDCEVIARAYGVIQFENPRLTLTFYFKDKRGLQSDGDNMIASFKSGRDGLADAGIVANDRAFTIGEIRRAVDRENPRLVVEIRESADADHVP